MSTHCFMVDDFSDLWLEGGGHDNLNVGAMHDDGHLLVATPGGLVDIRRCGRWTVTGEPPNITMSPSLQVGTAGEPGSWHGYLVDGELRDA